MPSFKRRPIWSPMAGELLSFSYTPDGNYKLELKRPDGIYKFVVLEDTMEDAKEHVTGLNLNGYRGLILHFVSYSGRGDSYEGFRVYKGPKTTYGKSRRKQFAEYVNDVGSLPPLGWKGIKK